MIKEEEKLRMIRYAVKSPSGHNTQPWKFVMEENSIIIQPDFSRALPVVDPDDHALFISLGCALENLLIAAAEMSYKAGISFGHKEDWMDIRVELEKSDAVEKDPLFGYIEKRQVTRSKYRTEKLPQNDLDELVKTSDTKDVVIRPFVTDEDIRSLLPYIVEGSDNQFKNKAFVNELVSWIRFSEKEVLKKGDGIWGASMGFPSVPRWLGKFIMKKIVSAKSEAKRWRKTIPLSAGLMMFSVKENKPEHWVRLGQAFQCFGLKSTQMGLKHAHVNMPLEEVGVRQKLMEGLNLQNETPLLLIRFGYADALPYSYRRKLNDLVE
ncbi:MAG: hypothetical protein K9G67_02365 [Bacteroidales bacterium]|nr:hypothetical protein [Bacteroidales bacterium]MCF8343644.1 hypothetical protein [Bacteroidales bacterium]MCF8352260.1 hypothetical protein [Bacteroidales bacterium]MCF8375176.1 hypothetical protein [Bacteroidales bacterium]MCF8400702.1 hypothetical protein [Bacteroidales bacterium]